MSRMKEREKNGGRERESVAQKVLARCDMICGANSLLKFSGVYRRESCRQVSSPAILFRQSATGSLNLSGGAHV